MSWRPRKVTYGDLDLTPPTYAGTYTIDKLGAETPAQRAERKATERDQFPGWLHVIGTAITFLIVAGVFAGVGTVIGNQRNADVTDLWPTSVPSGERAEPEESAR